MRTILLKLLAFACLMAAGLALLQTWYPKDEANQYAKAIADKEARARSTPSPRLLLVGGSNLAFGVDSAALEQALRRPTVNLGVTMDFGREFILNQASAHARPGDSILLSLEYTLFTATPPRAVSLIGALHAQPSAWAYLGASQWRAVLDGGLIHFGFVARTSLYHAQGHYERYRGIYRRDAFNAHGDLISHYGLPPHQLSNRFLAVPDSELRAALQNIAAFVARCRAVGAAVYFELTPWPENWVQAQSATLERIHAGLEKIPGLTILNTPATLALPAHVFFDSEYHLLQAGRELRTQRLIRWLSAAPSQ